MSDAPSDRALNLVGQVVTYTCRKNGTHIAGSPFEAVVTKVEVVPHTTITRASGEICTAIRYRLRPLDGKRALWSTTFPDRIVEAKP